jgi:hypothetical protein
MWGGKKCITNLDGNPEGKGPWEGTWPDVTVRV